MIFWAEYLIIVEIWIVRIRTWVCTNCVREEYNALTNSSKTLSPSLDSRNGGGIVWKFLQPFCVSFCEFYFSVFFSLYFRVFFSHHFREFLHACLSGMIHFLKLSLFFAGRVGFTFIFLFFFGDNFTKVYCLKLSLWRKSWILPSHRASYMVCLKKWTPWEFKEKWSKINEYVFQLSNRSSR